MHNFKIKYIKAKIIEMNEEDSTIKKKSQAEFTCDMATININQ